MAERSQRPTKMEDEHLFEEQGWVLEIRRRSTCMGSIHCADEECKFKIMTNKTNKVQFSSDDVWLAQWQVEQIDLITETRH